MSTETLNGIIGVAAVLAGAIASCAGALVVYVKWQRDKDLGTIKSNAEEVLRLWAYNNSQDAKIKTLESKIEELHSERHRLIAENQVLRAQNEGQAGQLRDITAHNIALTSRVAELERHIGTLERRLSDMGGGKLGNAGQAPT